MIELSAGDLLHGVQVSDVCLCVFLVLTGLDCYYVCHYVSDNIMKMITTERDLQK